MRVIYPAVPDLNELTKLDVLILLRALGAAYFKPSVTLFIHFSIVLLVITRMS